MRRRNTSPGLLDHSHEIATNGGRCTDDLTWCIACQTLAKLCLMPKGYYVPALDETHMITSKHWYLRWSALGPVSSGILFCYAIQDLKRKKRMHTFSFWEQMRCWKERSRIKNRNHTLLQFSQEVFVFATIVSNPRDLHQDQVVKHTPTHNLFTFNRQGGGCGYCSHSPSFHL